MKVIERVRHIPNGNQSILYDVETEKYFLVSSLEQKDFADETLIFKCDENGNVGRWVEIWACRPSNHWGVVKKFVNGELTTKDFEEIE